MKLSARRKAAIVPAPEAPGRHTNQRPGQARTAAAAHRHGDKADGPPHTALSSVACGGRFRIVRLPGKAEVDRRLEAIGIRPGVEAAVLRASRRRPMIIALRDMRLALDRGLADSIMVALGHEKGGVEA